MNKLSFSQKNDLVVKHKSKKDFWKDLELFKKHYPSNKLMNDLGRANDFTYDRLDGQMLYLLLDKIPIDDILKNRIPPPTSVEESPTSPILPQGTLDSLAKEKLKELSKRLDALQDDLEINESDISDLQFALDDKDASIEDLQSKVEALEQKASGKKKDQTGGVPGNSMEQQLQS